MKAKLLFVLPGTIALFSISPHIASAQNIFPSTGSVGIGTTAPSTSSLFGIKSTTKGVLFPRMTSAQRSAVLSPAMGLVVYQTDGTPGFYYYHSGWKYLNPVTVSTSLSNLTATSINQPLIPAINAATDLGSSTKKWRNLYLSGTFTTNNLSVQNGWFYSDKASNVAWEGPSYFGRRARGTLTSPTAVLKGDILSSIWAAGYDGSKYQQNAGIEFWVDTTPTAGNIPGRIIFSTGSNVYNMKERLRIGSTGNFTFNNNQLFIEQATGNVGIGTNVLYPYSKLSVEGNTTIAEGLRVGKDVEVPLGAVVAGNYFDYPGTAIQGSSNGNEGSSSGVYGEALHGTGVEGISHAVGVSGWAMDGVGVTGSSNEGVDGHFYSNTVSGLTAGTGNWQQYAASFYGDVYADGIFQTSDRNLKKEIRNFDNALSIINKLKPKNYEFSSDARFSSLGLPKGHHYGLIAQELEEILPSLVKETKHEINKQRSELKLSEDGRLKVIRTGSKKDKETINIKAVNYIELIPVLIKGMQELNEDKDKQIQALQKQVDELRLTVESLSTKTTNVPLTQGFLKQCYPNPSVQSTTIGYYLPKNIINGVISISDVKGRLIKNFAVTSGEGQINIRSKEFPTGNYSYSLIGDGQRIDTKQMVIAR